MQPSLLKLWNLQCLNSLRQPNLLQNIDEKKQGQNSFQNNMQKPILKLPLQFTFPPVEIISKQLTKLNSKHNQRIIYLGPRWADSVVWHKKYSKNNSQIEQQNIQFNKSGYYFNQRRVLRNNNFIHDSMRQNRFFKNQIYYRAFEGMNPTLQQHQQIIFESRFQSGNLDCVVKINQNQYDLFLRIDTNTRGHIFWYYFKINLPKKSKLQTKRIKLNICNISKSKTLYQKNLKPYIKRTKQKDSNKKQFKPYENWTQGDGIHNCRFRQKKLRYKFIYDKIKCQKLHQLSFQIEIQPHEQISLAYSIPYTYSDLLNQLKYLSVEIKKKNIQNVHINKLQESLTGVEIPILTIGKIKNTQNQDQKKVIIITGRIHPGESNSSLIISSLFQQLCLKKIEKVFEKQIIFIIIPMINPDGVIFGNGRCSAIGRDLNRQFKSWNNYLNPEVVSIKKLIDKIQQTHQIQLYFDFHGHSKKKNVFFFGPNFSVTDPNYYRCRIFPKIFSKNLQFFRYFGCSYSICQAKRTTARAIMINQFNIPFFYTVQTSIGFFHDYNKRQDTAFTRQTLFKIGNKFKESLKEYFEGIEEYQQFLKSRKAAKHGQKNSLQKTQKNVQSQSSNYQQKVFQLKYIKIFDQIKTQSKLAQQNKNDDSQSDSDSYRKSEDLQAQKSKQFANMLVNFNKIQQNKIQNIISKTHRLNNEAQQKLNHQKKIKKKHSSEVNQQMITLIKRLSSKNQPPKNQFRIHSHSVPIKFQPALKQIKQQTKQNTLTFDIHEEIQKRQLICEQIQRVKLNVNRRSNDFNVSIHNFYKRNQLQFDLGQSQKIGIVNMSKMIQNPKSLRYSQYSQFAQQTNQKRIKSRSERRRQVNKKLQSSSPKNNNLNQNANKNFQIFAQQKQINFQARQNFNVSSFNIQNNGNFVSKPYPASFYRIKYQSSHKKYRQQSMDRTFYNFKKNVQEGKINSSTERANKSTTARKDQNLFISINKIQN